jgi:hypothetical protein
MLIIIDALSDIVIWGYAESKFYQDPVPAPAVNLVMTSVDSDVHILIQMASD